MCGTLRLESDVLITDYKLRITMEVIVYNHKDQFELLPSVTLVNARIGWLVIVSWGTVSIDFEWLSKNNDNNNKTEQDAV